MPFCSLEFKYGASAEGHWTYDCMVLQPEDCVDFVRTLYPQHQFLFLFDHSCGHDKSKEDALNVRNMGKLIHSHVMLRDFQFMRQFITNAIDCARHGCSAKANGSRIPFLSVGHDIWIHSTRRFLASPSSLIPSPWSTTSLLLVLLWLKVRRQRTLGRFRFGSQATREVRRRAT